MGLFNWTGLFGRSGVHFYGDFIDPFGYIGFHNLRRAAEETGTRIHWKGFELNPDTHAGGEHFHTAGNSDARIAMWASVTDYAQKAGLTLADPGFVPQSRLAHLLVLAWPGSSSTKNPLIEGIYQAYFNERKNIGEIAVLLDIADRFAVSKKVCFEMLRKAPPERLAAHRAEAEKHRFPGLPAYRFRKQTSFGALSTDAWRHVLKQ